jgi:hypothetical protein
MADEELSKELNSKFKYDVRNASVEHALANMHDHNARVDGSQARDRNNAMEGMASNRIMAGFKGGFGFRPNMRAGKASRISTATKAGVKGKLEQDYYDGVLVSETFTPY